MYRCSAARRVLSETWLASRSARLETGFVTLFVFAMSRRRDARRRDARRDGDQEAVRVRDVLLSSAELVSVRIGSSADQLADRAWHAAMLCQIIHLEIE